MARIGHARKADDQSHPEHSFSPELILTEAVTDVWRDFAFRMTHRQLARKSWQGDTEAASARDGAS
jgi:hypothetical protein